MALGSRTAAIGGLLAFGAWLLQPLLVFVLIGDQDRLTWVSLEQTAWSAPYEVLTFCLIGVGFFLLVSGIDTQCRSWGAVGPVASGGHLAGYVCVVAWLLVAAGQSAPFSSASSDLAALDVGEQNAALAIYGVVQMGVLLFAVLCGAGWLVMIGTHARARGVVGRPTAYAALIAAVAALVPFAVPFSAPWGALGIFVMALWLGLHQFRASRVVTAPTAATALTSSGER